MVLVILKRPLLISCTSCNKAIFVGWALPTINQNAYFYVGGQCPTPLLSTRGTPTGAPLGFSSRLRRETRLMRAASAVAYGGKPSSCALLHQLPTEGNPPSPNSSPSSAPSSLTLRRSRTALVSPRTLCGSPTLIENGARYQSPLVR